MLLYLKGTLLWSLVHKCSFLIKLDLLTPPFMPYAFQWHRFYHFFFSHNSPWLFQSAWVIENEFSSGFVFTYFVLVLYFVDVFVHSRFGRGGGRWWWLFGDSFVLVFTRVCRLPWSFHCTSNNWKNKTVCHSFYLHFLVS